MDQRQKDEGVAFWLTCHGQAQRVHDFKQFYRSVTRDGKSDLRYSRESDVVTFADAKVDLAWRFYEMGCFESLADVMKSRTFVSEIVRNNYENSK